MRQQLRTSSRLEGEEGYVIAYCLMALLLVTLMGVMAIRTSGSDLQVTTNNQIYKKSFYAAEAARAYVRNNSLLYGSDNIYHGTPVAFPIPQTRTRTETEFLSRGSPSLSTGPSSTCSRACRRADQGTRSGNSGRTSIDMTCRGHGPREAVTTIEAGFYRIGFLRGDQP